MTEISSDIQLYDSEIEAMDRGPLKWLVAQQGKPMVLDTFVRTVVGKFDEIGLRSRVNTYETTEPGTYAFDIVINGRHVEKEFDFDRMVHEVQNNLLDIPGEGGTIKSDLAKAPPVCKH